MIGQWLTRRHESAAKKTAVGYALAAEIEPYVDIVDRRGWVELAEQLANQARAGVAIKVDGWLTKDEKPNDFPVFNATLPNIGVLGSSARDISSLYSRVIAVRTTVSEMQNGAYSNMTPAQIAHLIDEEVALWRETISDGRKLVAKLNLAK
ncbi:MAG: hypothetical protein AAAB20_10970 [Rhizobium sp.]|uniref:hypothetical protein n=1 Tax=Rhizobium sp. TaxID=391 RepID=UPI0030F0AA84